MNGRLSTMALDKTTELGCVYPADVHACLQDGRSRSRHSAAAGSMAVASAAMDVFEVPLAAGTRDGEEITITLPDNRLVIVTVPPGQSAQPTMLIEVPSTHKLVVTVPVGISAGQTFLIEAPNNAAIFSVECPEGVGDGDTIDVELQAAGGAFAEQPETLTAKGGDEEAPSSAVISRHQPSSAAAPAATGATHSVGQRFKVLRTNGSWTPATIVEADECSGMFTVRLDQGGALKYFVEASDLASLDHEPTAAGEHYEGRRVQVCVDGQEKPLRGESWHVWEGAVIRGYDADTGTYTCELDRGGADGGTRHGLRATDIRVRQRV